MLEEGYKQLKVNARQRAMDYALQARAIGFDSVDMATGRVEKKIFTADELIIDAKKIEEYILSGIEVPKSSSILKATTGPSH